MLLSEGAGAAGLIRRSRIAAFFVAEIAEITYRELKGLDKVCGCEVRRNHKRRKRAHRENLLQLLGFYLSVTERFLISCGIPSSSEYLRAVTDGAREAALSDPWRKPQHPLQQPISDYLRAFSCQRHVQEIRERYPALPGHLGLPPEMLRELAIAIALRIVRDPADADYARELSLVIQARLQRTANELLNRPPYRELQGRIRTAASGTQVIV